jgi:PIN domain nuclease of toxin-antitoxin system
MRALLDTHAFIWWVTDDSQLIAQSQVENLPIVTIDEQITQYAVQTIW